MSAARLLVLVRGAADLPRACDDLSELLAFRRRHDAAAQETLLGLWVDPGWVEHIPHELRWRETDGTGGTACLHEATGIDGIWMLCRLDVPDGVQPPSRQGLLTSLVAAFGPVSAELLPGFVPVFGLDVPAGEAQAELQRLADLHADLMLAPLHQDPGSGRLETPAFETRAGLTRTQSPRRGGPVQPCLH